MDQNIRKIPTLSRHPCALRHPLILFLGCRHEGLINDLPVPSTSRKIYSAVLLCSFRRSCCNMEPSIRDTKKFAESDQNSYILYCANKNGQEVLYSSMAIVQNCVPPFGTLQTSDHSSSLLFREKLVNLIS